MDKINIKYDELINYILPISSNDKENKRQTFLDELSRLKTEGQLNTPDIYDEKINRAIRIHIYQYFYNQIISSGNDHIITAFKDNGEEVTFSLLEVLTLKNFTNEISYQK